MTCDHSAYHSGSASFMREEGELRLVVVCDDCGAEQAELEPVAYAPKARRLGGQLAELTARELGLTDEQIARVRFAALICVVGRAQIPPEVLNKQGPLTEEEWILVRRQPELGAALFSKTSFDDIREWILAHRERPDGLGYPRGLVAEQIPLEALILSVTEAYTAMRSDRPYQLARDHEDACAELSRCAGSQFDTAVVEAFLRGCAQQRHRQPVHAAS